MATLSPTLRREITFLRQGERLLVKHCQFGVVLELSMSDFDQAVPRSVAVTTSGITRKGVVLPPVERHVVVLMRCERVVGRFIARSKTIAEESAQAINDLKSTSL